MCDVLPKKSDDSYIQFITHVGGIDLITDELTRMEYGDLACLENVVHRSGEGLSSLFRVMVIDVPDGVLIDTIQPETLPPDWTDYQHYGGSQQLGGNGLRRGQSAVLRVPSASIANEWNYLLNPAHPAYQSVQLLQTEPFLFDLRIKQT